ncbi:MAG: 4-(cytidine 5'-diphospho)-2-C-methyl-D-erythritol kinase [Gammaproteobacteria bacterium]|nr:4-(cytidine 5'-diphospho)-2-C-methyl-D-erythritol kinase [Gammaproteobacteria bacterium]
MTFSNPESWPAPAKINLFLHVTGRRPDGYHTLQTAFQFLDHADELTFEVTDDRRISRSSDIPGVAEDADLCVRAARILQNAAGVDRGVVLHAIKRIPQGGGLGGGSSDAATTLLALNRLWGLNLSLPELAKIALQLGADVPVFVYGRAAWGEGIGEVLTPMSPAEPWYVVLVPPVHVSTQAVFAEFDRDIAAQLTHYSQPITIRDFHTGGAHNDLEAVVRRLYPQVDKALIWLGNFGNARMTGSGSCVYMATTGPDQAWYIAGCCPQDCATSIVARGINEHPIRRQYGDV